MTENIEHAIPCQCGRGQTAEIIENGHQTIIPCDSCQDERDAARERMARTLEIHRELMALWGIEDVYNVTLTLFPPSETYDAISEDEVMAGTDRDIPLKYVKIQDGFAHTEITFHAPSRKEVTA